MRAISLLVLLVVSGPARAGGFAEVGVGVMVPAADDDWTNYVDPAPKVFARGGFIKNAIGGMLSVDWTPINADRDAIPVIGTLDISSNRFRILGNIVVHAKIGAKLTASGRFGIGIDILQISATYRLGMFETTTDDSDSGLALEPGGGIWYQVGESLHIGGELGLPMSFHSYDMSNDIQLNDFTSLDIDLLFNLRYIPR